jgi:hypothetical protein
LRINFEYLHENWANIAMVSEREVIQTVNDPIIRQKVEVSDLKVLFFLRKDSYYDNYLLMLGQYDNNEFTPSLILKVRADLLQEVGNEPLVLLQQFAENFGINQTIGNKTKKFFLREVVDIIEKISDPLFGPNAENIVRTKFPKNIDVAQSLFWRYSDDFKQVVCAFVITLNVDKYKEWLNKKTDVRIVPKKYDVFISYKRNTAKDFALNLKKCLTEEGYRAFLDITDIRKEFEGTSKWFDERDAAIRNSKRFLLIMTIRVESSEEVTKEIALARTVQGIKFVYLRHTMIDPQMILNTKSNEEINLSEGNQESFDNEVDLVRKVLKILEDSEFPPKTL